MLVGDRALDGTSISELTKGSEKYVTLKCDKCGKFSKTIYHNYTLAQAKNGNTGKTQCKTCAIKEAAKKRRGRPAWNKGKRLPLDECGPKHPSWKGGRYIDSYGYVMVHFYNPNAKNKWAHYKKEHVIIMQEFLERELTANEIVHHIDGDKQNNKINNLALLNSHQEHRNVHVSLQQIGYELVKRGLIKFDIESLSYMADQKLRELLEQPDEANQQPSQNGDVLERFND